METLRWQRAQFLILSELKFKRAASEPLSPQVQVDSNQFSFRSEAGRRDRSKMVHSNINDTMIKDPYQEIKKGKEVRASPGRQSYQQQHPQSTPKNDKYGSWGPIYKNKQNFIDMHTC